MLEEEEEEEEEEEDEGFKFSSEFVFGYNAKNEWNDSNAPLLFHTSRTRINVTTARTTLKILANFFN